MQRDEPKADGFDDDDLQLVLNQNLGVGVDSDLEPEVRFQAGVTRLIKKRLARGGGDNSPALFLLEPTPPSDVPSDVWQVVPMLDNGLTPVGGQLWFVNQVVAAGVGVAIDDWDDAKVFRHVIDDLGLGTTPAILFETRIDPPEARFFPTGLATPNNYQPIRLAGANIPLADIFAVIQTVYEHCLVTPDAQGRSAKLWKNARRHWAAENAEDLVQVYLRAGLTTALGCTVRPEQTQATGRLDLEIEEIDWTDGSVVRHAVLELKVLRSFGSTGSPVSESDCKSWVEEGVRQAATYRDERGARSSALCCFDMRTVPTGEACFAHVVRRSKRLKVQLRAWHLFSTSKEYRKFLTAGK